jgi:hypothetical protein
MNENGQVFPRLVSLLSIDNIMQLYPLPGLKKSMSKSLERSFVQAPVLVLRCRTSVSLSPSSLTPVLQHHTPVVIFTGSQLALLLGRVACPQGPARERGRNPDAREAEEPEAELESVPRESGERCAHGRRRVVQFSAGRRCVDVRWIAMRCVISHARMLAHRIRRVGRRSQGRTGHGDHLSTVAHGRTGTTSCSMEEWRQ